MQQTSHQQTKPLISNTSSIKPKETESIKLTLIKFCEYYYHPSTGVSKIMEPKPMFILQTPKHKKAKLPNSCKSSNNIQQSFTNSNSNINEQHSKPIENNCSDLESNINQDDENLVVSKEDKRLWGNKGNDEINQSPFIYHDENEVKFSYMKSKDSTIDANKFFSSGKSKNENNINDNFDYVIPFELPKIENKKELTDILDKQNIAQSKEQGHKKNTFQFIAPFPVKGINNSFLFSDLSLENSIYLGKKQERKQENETQSEDETSSTNSISKQNKNNKIRKIDVVQKVNYIDEKTIFLVEKIKDKDKYNAYISQTKTTKHELFNGRIELGYLKHILIDNCVLVVKQKRSKINTDEINYSHYLLQIMRINQLSEIQSIPLVKEAVINIDQTLLRQMKIKRIQNKRKGFYNKFTEEAKEFCIEMYKKGKILLNVISALCEVSTKSLKRWVHFGCKRRKGCGRKMLEPEMQNKLIEWYNEQIESGIFPSSYIIRRKARKLSKIKTFEASKGWLEKFRKKNNIRVFSNRQYKLSCLYLSIK